MLLLLLIGMLVLKCHLNSLSFFVQIYVCNIAPIKTEVFLSHRAAIKGLIHPITCRSLSHSRYTSLCRGFGSSNVMLLRLEGAIACASHGTRHRVAIILLR